MIPVISSNRLCFQSDFKRFVNVVPHQNIVLSLWFTKRFCEIIGFRGHPLGLHLGQRFQAISSDFRKTWFCWIAYVFQAISSDFESANDGVQMHKSLMISKWFQAICEFRGIHKSIAFYKDYVVSSDSPHAPITFFDLDNDFQAIQAICEIVKMQNRLCFPSDIQVIFYCCSDGWICKSIEAIPEIA